MAAALTKLRGGAGYLTVLLLAYLSNPQRRQVRWRPVLWGLTAQFALALVVLNPAVGRFFFTSVDQGVRALLSFADAGTNFLFQATSPHEVTYLRDGELVTELFAGRMSPALKSFAFWVLPTVIFFSSLVTVLYHLGLVQRLVRVLARAMVHLLGTSGAETLSCTANIFVGATEAPLLVRPFIETMTRSELMAVMTGGFATVAGGVLAIYVGLLGDVPGIAGHLVTASIMAAPAALAVAKLMLPETEAPTTAGHVQLADKREDANVIEAAARGASDGLGLALNIGAMLLAFVGLMAMINALLGLADLSLQQLLGWLLAPLAWLLGVPWSEAQVLGRLLGIKLIATELVAYQDLSGLLQQAQPALGARTAIMASYMLCGFANVPTIGVQLGGLGAMAPSRRADLAQLSLRAMLAGAAVSCLSGTVVGWLT